MIGCKQLIIPLYYESENDLKFYNLEACLLMSHKKGDRLIWINLFSACLS